MTPPDAAESSSTTAASASPETRRNFLVQAAAVVIGSFVACVPLVAGMRMFFGPLFRRKEAQADEAIRVTTLDAMPEIGKVYRFKVIAERSDAWSKYPPGPIGAVYLRRLNGTDPPVAFTATCPHLGCAVDYKADRNMFQCPCHNSLWQVDGTLIAGSVSPRGLDPVEVKVRGGNEVYVVFKKFRSGTEERHEV